MVARNTDLSASRLQYSHNNSPVATVYLEGLLSRKLLPVRLSINVGQYRKGDMQVVSGVMGKETIHFEAPKAERVSSEMKTFLDWINIDSQNSKIDDVIKSAIAHLWFVTIHPFVLQQKKVR